MMNKEERLAAYEGVMTGFARLYILRELAKQSDGRLNDLSLRLALDMYGIRRDRDWVRTQLRKLEALGAIELNAAGEMFIARIVRAGRDHLEERAVIEGVTRPADAE